MILLVTSAVEPGALTHGTLAEDATIRAAGNSRLPKAQQSAAKFRRQLFQPLCLDHALVGGVEAMSQVAPSATVVAPEDVQLLARCVPHQAMARESVKWWYMWHQMQKGVCCSDSLLEWSLQPDVYSAASSMPSWNRAAGCWGPMHGLQEQVLQAKRQRQQMHRVP